VYEEYFHLREFPISLSPDPRFLRPSETHLEQTSQETDVALVMNTAGLEPIDLFKLTAAEFRLAGSFETKADYIIALNRYLLDRLESGLSPLAGWAEAT
jgi:hypothetical protein